jgi:hypothetical protein
MTSRALSGTAAGALAATLWAFQQPLDKRLFGTRYDDVELLGKMVTRGPWWRPLGLLVHASNGAAFGVAYALSRPRLPGRPLTQAVAVAMVENFGFWPAGRLIDRFHPARRELEPLTGNSRALAAATWRHVLFGIALGVVEPRLNPVASSEPPPKTGRHS